MVVPAVARAEACVDAFHDHRYGDGDMISDLDNRLVTTQRTVQRKPALTVTLCLWVAVTTGCAPRSTIFEITDYHDPRNPKRYVEEFDEAYYDLDEHGNVDLVLRRSQPAGSGAHVPITQIIHIRSFWRSIPGATVAHRTQVNGTVTYLIQTGQVASIFEGAGSIFFKQHRRNDVLTGTLDLAQLRPVRRAATDSPLFQKTQLRGEFRAERNPRKVLRLINDLNRQLPSH